MVVSVVMVWLMRVVRIPAEQRLISMRKNECAEIRSLSLLAKSGCLRQDAVVWFGVELVRRHF